MGRSKTNEEVIDAYKETGSIWAAGKKLGIPGQLVCIRLKALDYPLYGRRWTAEEIAELRVLAAEEIPIGQIASRLGRPYASIASKLSEFGLTKKTKKGQLSLVKIPRGAGYDKAKIRKRLGELECFDGTVSAFCRTHSLNIEPFVKAVQRHFPERWELYTKTHAIGPQKECAYCERLFYPMNQKQNCCCRKCSSHLRADKQYFGGKRRQTVGLEEGRCQLCLQQHTVLSSHHLYGKENDPENDYLVALCQGCHHILSSLASRKFVTEPEGWERLISLVLARRYGGDKQIGGTWTFVDVEVYTHAEWAEAEGLEAVG